MIVETIFYITGSIFFTIAIVMLGVVIIYTFKILQKIVAIETEIKNTVTEVKIKIATFSFGLTSAIAILEKLVDMKNKRSQNRAKKNETPRKNTDEPPVKKIRIRKIFGAKN